MAASDGQHSGASGLPQEPGGEGCFPVSIKRPATPWSVHTPCRA